ncbi:sensor histidine kinase [Actinomadura alba]|uniref:histidine kinase n=1 Tax=Actinomadura alba TaxID=406431 RepID=A0ABR7LRD0_9ACTN|nr:ATP-binding protein [Actinomadura alba]MBC6467334.1 ATP-binding protein [Actinomadura alba]
MIAEAGTAPAEPVTAAALTERALLKALAWFRVGGLVQIAIALALNLARYPHVGRVLVMVGVVAAESVVLIAVCTARGRVAPGWILADVLFCASSLALGAAMITPSYGHSWVHFMYPFTIITSFGIGVAFRRVTTMVTVTAVLSLSYAVSAIVFHRDPIWNVLPNALSYHANTLVAWTVTRQLRRSGHAADGSRAEAIARATELAEERERSKHARILHDHALQTLETIAQGPWLADAELRAHVGAEAARLRALVEGVRPDAAGDLEAELHALVRRLACTGLRVTYNGAHLRKTDGRRTRLSPEVSAAVVDAAGEALTNVAKHAGVTTATLHARAGNDRLTVTVVDQGRGFDPDAVRDGGVGLEISIRRRMRDVGGEARVESSAGQGTCVELTVPLASPGAGDARSPSRR